MLENIFMVVQFIVGPTYGYSGGGCIQWYCNLSIAINIMIAWTRYPSVALPFTILFGLFFASVYVYALLHLEEKDIDSR
mgnify:CR=1 FL=1